MFKTTVSGLNYTDTQGTIFHWARNTTIEHAGFVSDREVCRFTWKITVILGKILSQTYSKSQKTSSSGTTSSPIEAKVVPIPEKMCTNANEMRGLLHRDYQNGADDGEKSWWQLHFEGGIYHVLVRFNRYNLVNK